MTVTVVDDTSDVSTSIQLITVPFRPLLTGLISNLDTTGNLSWEDVLEILNTVELTVSSDMAALAGSVERTFRKISVDVVSFPRITLNLHSRKPPVVVHVSSN